MNQFTTRDQIKVFAGIKFGLQTDKISSASMVPVEDNYAVISKGEKHNSLIVGNIHQAESLTLQTEHRKVVLTPKSDFVVLYDHKESYGANEVQIARLLWQHGRPSVAYSREFLLSGNGPNGTFIDEKVRAILPFENNNNLLITSSGIGRGIGASRHFINIFNLDRLDEQGTNNHPYLRKFKLALRPLHQAVSPDGTMAALTFGANSAAEINRLKRNSAPADVVQAKDLSLSNEPLVLIVNLDLDSPRGKKKGAPGLINAFDFKREPVSHKILYSEHFSSNQQFEARGFQGDPISKVSWKGNGQLEIRLLNNDQPQVIPVDNFKS